MTHPSSAQDCKDGVQTSEPATSLKDSDIHMETCSALMAPMYHDALYDNYTNAIVPLTTESDTGSGTEVLWIACVWYLISAVHSRISPVDFSSFGCTYTFEPNTLDVWPAQVHIQLCYPPLWSALNRTS